MLLVVLLTIASASNVTGVVRFAEDNWNCATASCGSRVKAGTYQPSYQCAEFVSRSLAAGGWIPGIGPHDSQNAYYTYSHNGKHYDLLWVSNVQGGPLGLEDLLKVLGWKNVGKAYSSCHAASVVICQGAEGPHSHVAIGIADDLTDAHNMARYHAPLRAYLGIDAIYHPPGTF